jgi:hypothetical protein
MTGHTRGLIALALIVVTVLALLLAGVMVYRSHHLTDEPFSLSNSGRQIPSDAERHEVVARAEQFCLRVDAFNGDDPDAYRKQVTPMLTTKYKKSFDTEFDAIEKLGVQRGQQGKGKVVVSGISDLDQDSATVLVVHDNTITSSTGTVQRHYRWTIDLAKVDGTWLIDDFTPVS